MEWNVETVSRCCGKKSNTMLSLEELLSMRQRQTPKKCSNSNNNSNVNYLKGNSRTNSSKEKGLRVNSTPIRKEIEWKYSIEFSKLTTKGWSINDLTALGIFWCRTKNATMSQTVIFWKLRHIFNGWKQRSILSTFYDTFYVLTPIIFLFSGNRKNIWC